MTEGTRSVLAGATTALVLGWLYWPDWLGTGGILEDANAYWNAAHRLTSGGDLYDSGDFPYRYAPWFAYLWVPLTLLPKVAAMGAWLGVLLLATVAVCRDLARQSALVAAVMLPVLGYSALVGNSQPLVVALVYFGLPHRSGPLWIALAASMKIAPALFALEYVARREWRKLAYTVALTALLMAPMLGFDLSVYPSSQPGGRMSLWQHAGPLVGLLVSGVLAGTAIWLAVRGSRWTLLAVGLTLSLGHPRAVVSYLGFLAPAMRPGTRPRRSSETPQSRHGRWSGWSLSSGRRRLRHTDRW